MSRVRRRAFLAGVGASLLAGCLDGIAGGNGDETTEASVDPDANQDLRRSTLDLGDATGEAPPTTTRDLPLPAEKEAMVDDFRTGAPKDAIPAIDEPQFMDGAAVTDELDAGDPVFGVVLGDDVRAYPQNILVWHEIVNDVLDGTPVSITYCPLTGTAQGFARGATTFGVSGFLLNSNLVMYDRASDSYWPQMLAVALDGEHECAELPEFDLVWTDWESWLTVHPETELLTTDTGYVRDYGRDPYGGYNPPTGHYADGQIVFPAFRDDIIDEFHVKEVVLGARTEDGAIAVQKDELAEAGLLRGDLDGTEYVFAFDPPLNTGWCYRNPDGQTLAYDDGEVTVDGTAHPSYDLPLESVVRYDAMWFAWGGYYPDTTILTQ